MRLLFKGVFYSKKYGKRLYYPTNMYDDDVGMSQTQIRYVKRLASLINALSNVCTVNWKSRVADGNRCSMVGGGIRLLSMILFNF